MPDVYQSSDDADLLRAVTGNQALAMHPEAMSSDIQPVLEGKSPLISDTAERTLSQKAKFTLPGLTAGFFDTVGQSTGIFSDTSMENMLTRAFGPKGLGDFYARDKQSLRYGGEVIGLVLPGLMVPKAINGVRWLREAGKFGQFLKNSTAVEAILGSSTRLTETEEAIRLAAASQAKTFTAFSGRTFAVPAVDAAKRTYLGARAIESVRQAVAFEATYRTLFNDSEFLYPADYTLSDEFKWFGAGTAAGTAIDFAIGRYAARALIKGVGAKLGPIVPAAEGIANAMLARPGERGLAVTQLAAYKKQITELRQTATPALASNINSDLTVVDNIIQKHVRAMARDEHAVLPQNNLDELTKVPGGAPGEYKLGQTKLMVDALAKNETILVNATKLAQVPENNVDFFGEIDATVKKLEAQLSKKQERLGVARKPSVKESLNRRIAKNELRLDEARQARDALKDEVHYVVENTGDIAPYRGRAWNWLDTHAFADMKLTHDYTVDLVAGSSQKVSHPILEVFDDKVGKIKVFDNFRYEMSSDRPEAHSARYAIMSRMIEKWKPVQGQQLVLNERLPWQQIEATLALGQKHPEAAKTITWDGAFRNEKDAQFFVLSEKYKGFLKDMRNTEREPTNPVARAAWARSKITPAQVLQKYNLPGTLELEPHPLLQAFQAFYEQGHATLDDALRGVTAREHPMDLLQGAMKEALGVQMPIGKDIPFQGTMLKQRDVRPVLVAATAPPWSGYSQARMHALVEQQIQRNIQRLAEIDPAAAPMSRGVIDMLLNLGAVQVAKDVNSVHEGVVSGRGILTGQDRVNEQLDTLKAAQLASQLTDKFMETVVGKLAEAKMTPLVAALKKPQNATARVDFNRIEQSYRHGFYIDSVEYDASGVAKFVLDKESDVNRKLMKQFFNITVDDSHQGSLYLPDMSVTAKRQGYLPLQVKGEAAKTAEAISELSIQSGIENNALRHALGQPQIPLRKFHLPTPELNREGTWFVRNDAGRVVNTYSGGTAAENQRRAFAAVEELKATSGADHAAVSLDAVRRDHNAFDDTFFDVIDYADQLAKSGLGITGGLARTEIDVGTQTLERMVSSLNEQFLNVGTRARAALFAPQLNYARQASQVTALSDTAKKLGEYNVFDRYQGIIFSKSPQNPRGWVAKAYGALETPLDMMMNIANVHYTELSGGDASRGARQLRQILKKDISDDEYRQYQKMAEGYSPFHSTEEFLESTYRERTPPSVKALSSQLAKTSSTLSLRIADLGTAMLNFTGLLTTAPAVVSALRRLPSDLTHDDWVKRTAAYSSRYVDGIATFSPMKAMLTSQHAFWSGALNGPMERAAAMGLFEPEYSALAKALSDPIHGGKNWLETFVDKASWLADHSEAYSRKMSWGMGYKIGMDLHKFEDEKNAFIFANNFMNDMIGNYNPRNKPGMFQGAIGLALGAYQTYMFNYFRRMYGYIERKDVRSVAAAYAAQAAVFGAKSVPGFDLFNKTMFDNYDGSDNMATRLDRKFSPGVAELLEHGSLSSIPKIFGGGGIAFYARGSTDVTQPPPTIADISRAPPLQFMWNTAQIATRTIGNFFGAGGFSLQQQEEILANFATNRAFKSVMEQAANAKVDRRGGVVEYGTRDALNIAASVLGAQTTHMKQYQDGYMAQQNVELAQTALRAKLNDHTRAIIRGGEFDISDLQDLASDYQRSGGNPAYFGQWLRNTMDTAVTPKAEKKLKELAGSQRWLEFMNLLAAMQQN